jgi:transcriptional regulator with XRE-family HTH domain
MDETWDFGARLRTLRKLRGFKRARAAADRLGIQENTYTRYERGQSEPSFKLLRRMMQEFRITPNELFSDEPLLSVPGPPGFSEGDATGAPALTGAAPAEFAFQERRAGDDPQTVAWRLAREFARLKRTDGKDEDPLAELARASTLFLELEREPYRTIARLLAEPSLASLPKVRQARLSRDVDLLLRHGEDALGS